MIRTEAVESQPHYSEVSYADTILTHEKVIGFRIESIPSNPPKEIIVMYGVGQVLGIAENQAPRRSPELVVSFKPLIGDTSLTLARSCDLGFMPEPEFEEFVQAFDDVPLEIGNYHILEHELDVERRGGKRFH